MSSFLGMVHIEKTKGHCDHCGANGEIVILSSEFNNKVDGSIQLCKEHALFFASEILKIFESTE